MTVPPFSLVTHLDELADVDLETVPPSTGDTLVRDASGVWVPGTASGFDPETPLDYLTMTDQITGDSVVVTVESGAWVFSSPLTTVDGVMITTVSGDPITVE